MSVWQEVRACWLAPISHHRMERPLAAVATVVPDVLTSLTGEHINVDALVYLLKNLSDFAGTYTRVAPEVARATWGSDSDAIFQNGKGVVVQILKGPRDESLYLSLLGNSFQVLLSDF